MAVSKELILNEIRRCAADNGDTPLGRMRFERETGIREGDWLGRYWTKWGDALTEAGFSPNHLQGRFEDGVLLEKLALLVRELGHFPTGPEMRLQRRIDPTLPSDNVFERFGSKQDRIALIVKQYKDDQSFADVMAICEPLVIEPTTEGTVVPQGPELDGEVYLLKSGRHYKIGRTGDVGRRRYDIALQLPEKHTLVHSIRTDDPVGIERYWHTRFAGRRANGEWFSLSANDVRAFKRRKFM